MTSLIKYTDLKDIIDNGDYSFYGIIYDATFPTKDEESKSYVCSIKLIAPGLNWLTDPENLVNECINVIVKSNNLNEIPVISEIGSILRVHRGVYRFKKRKNVYLNMSNIFNIKSSWVVFESK